MTNEGVGRGSSGDAGAIIEVAIGPGTAPGRFKVEVIRSPAGEATEEIELDPAALLARRRELQHALLASAVPTRRYLSETEQPVREVGEALYAALLGAGEVAGRYRSAAAIAQLREHGLRLSLRIDIPELAGLPWEAMYDRAADSYVCLQDQLVRRVNVASVPAPLSVQPPLRILGIVSAPRGLPSLDVDKERDLLTRALARPVDESLASLTWAPTATWADLQDLLLSQQWHVLHFIGHGDFDPTQDEGVLVLTDESGRPDPVDAHRFTDLLREARPRPRLVVLNSCSGAVVGVTDLFSGTAAALVRGGVSAVVAMQYEISDAASAAFARGFYSAIANGRGVDDAVSSGRRAIRGSSSRTLEWLTPVLYLRGDETQLFQVPVSAVPQPKARVSKVRVSKAEAPRARASEAPAEVSPERPPRKVAAPARSDPPTTGDWRLARVLSGHNGTVTGVAFSASGGFLATGSMDRTVRLWQPATGQLNATLTGYRLVVDSVAVSPDDLWIATCGPWTVQVRSVSPAKRFGRVFRGHDSNVAAVVFSPDGTMLASAGLDGIARIWNVTTRQTIRILRGHHTQGLTGVAFSPTGELVATTSFDNTARLWDVRAGQLLHTLADDANGACAVAFSPEGSTLATGCSDGANLWEVATGALIRHFAGHRNGRSVAISPDGTLLATAGLDQTVRLWDLATGTPIQTLTGHRGEIEAVAFSPEGRFLATASYDRTTQLWENTKPSR